jgi:uncharacterized membrane protein YhfC
MISNETIAGVALASLIAMSVPFILFFTLHRRMDLRLRNVFIGVGVFILFVVVLEAALHAYLLKLNPTTKAWFDAHAMGFAVYAALAAAFFEETGRYLAMRYLARPVPGSGTPVAYGIGHGGAEAFLIGLNIAVIAVLGYLMMTGQAASLKLDAATTEQIQKSLAGASFGASLLGGIERVFALVLQIGLSLLVWQAVHARRFIFLLGAFAFHFAFDLPAAMMQKGLLPLTIVEIEVGYGLLALLTVAAIWAFAPRASAAPR